MLTNDELKAMTVKELRIMERGLGVQLREKSAQKNVPWHTLATELAVIAEDRRLVLAELGYRMKWGKKGAV